jgi:lipoprotein-anchoring transpeptidase ErfK/SrfK
MIDTDLCRWRRSLRPTLPMPVLALLAIVIAGVLNGCGSSGNGHPSSTSSSTSTSGIPVVRTSSHAGATHADVAAPKHRSAPSGAPPITTTVVALVKRSIAERSAPGHRGHVLGTLATHTEFGSPTAVPVVRRQGAWLGVISVLAGNGHVGWIPASAASLTGVALRIYISIDRQQITVLYGNYVVRRIPTSTGVPGAATPTGRFAVTDRLKTGVEVGPYGCCILALSGIQPLHLSDWDGGNRIAIHATDDTEALGTPASHGCAHVSDAEGRWLLAHIPDGTLVVIADAPFHRGRGSPA